MQFKPKNKHQYDLIRSVGENEITIAIGPAGSAKTCCAIYCAYSHFLSGSVKRIIITRPTVETSGIKGKSIGALPGDIMEKMSPYMRPIYDEFLAHCVKTKPDLDKLILEGLIEIVPLEFMRGRNFNDCFVVGDEFQNASATELDMFVTRLGRNSKMIINGDIIQSDLPDYLKGGLEDYINALTECKGVGIIKFTNNDVVRNPLITHVMKFVRNYRKEKYGEEQQGTGS